MANALSAVLFPLLGNAPPIAVSDRSHVKQLDASSSPRRFSKKCEAGFNAWIVGEATDFDPIAQLFPSVLVDQMLQNLGERHAVEQIVRLWWVRCHGFAILHPNRALATFLESEHRRFWILVGLGDPRGLQSLDDADSEMERSPQPLRDLVRGENGW